MKRKRDMRRVCVLRHWLNILDRIRSKKTFISLLKRPRGVWRHWIMSSSMVLRVSGRQRWPISLQKSWGWDQVNIRSGRRTPGGSGRDPDEPPEAGGAVYRRDPQAESRHRGGPLSCHGGLQDRHYYRTGAGGKDDQIRYTPFHIDWGDHEDRPAYLSAAGPVRHHHTA